jgi:hypothetical protein
VDSLDKLLRLSRIPDRLPHRPDGTAERGITDELIGPDLCTQLLLGHDMVPMFHKIHQDGKGFGSEMNGVAMAQQDMALGVEHTLPKGVDHTTPHCSLHCGLCRLCVTEHCSKPSSAFHENCTKFAHCLQETSKTNLFFLYMLCEKLKRK